VVISWKAEEPETAVLHLASRIQHQQCVIILQAVEREFAIRGLMGYTMTVGRPYEQFRRIMSGDAVIQIRDLAEAKVYFGDTINLNVPALRSGITAPQ
jgi:hypothetical protein